MNSSIRWNALTVEISGSCQLSCAYCEIRQLGTPKLMSQDTFSTLRDSWSAIRELSLAELAEPLLHPHVATFIREVKDRHTGCRIDLITNGESLSKDLGGSLLVAGLDVLCVSLDSPRTDSPTLRHGTHVDRIVENIRGFQETKAILGRMNVPLVVISVAHRSNIRQLSQMPALLASLGAEAWVINHLEPYSSASLDETLWLPAPGDARMIAALDQIRTDSEAVGVRCSVASTQPTPPSCPLIHRPVVLPSGDVVPCHVLAYARHRFVAVGRDLTVHVAHGKTEPLFFGNVHQRSLPDIWNSRPYADFRTAVQDGRFPEPCALCLFKHHLICPLPDAS